MVWFHSRQHLSHQQVVVGYRWEDKKVHKGKALTTTQVINSSAILFYAIEYTWNLTIF
jgi:hypothetical protein